MKRIIQSFFQETCQSHQFVMNSRMPLISTMWLQSRSLSTKLFLWKMIPTFPSIVRRVIATSTIIKVDDYEVHSADPDTISTAEALQAQGEYRRQLERETEEAMWIWNNCKPIDLYISLRANCMKRVEDQRSAAFSWSYVTIPVHCSLKSGLFLVLIKLQ